MYGGMGSSMYGGTGYGGMGSGMYGGTGYSGIGMNNGIDMLNNNNMINGIGQQHNSNGSHLQTRNIQGVTSGHRNQPLQSDRGVNAQQNGVNGGDQFNNHNGQSNDSNDRPKPTQVDIEQLRQQRDYSKKQKRFFLLQATTQLLSQVVMCIVQGLRGVQEVVMLSFGAYYSANMVRDFVDAYKRQQKRNIAPQGRDQGGQYDGQRHYSQLQQQGVTGKSSSPLLFKIKTVLLAAAMYTILNGGMSLCFRMMHNDKWKRSLSEQKKQWLPKLLGVLGIPLIGNAGSSVHPLIANWLGVGMRRDEEVNDIVHRNEAIDTDASMCEDISSRECIHVVQSGNREDDEGNIRLSGASDAATTDGDSEGDTEFEQYFRQIQENEEKENLYRIHNSQSNNATVPLSYHDYGGLAPVHQGNFAPSNRGSGLIYVAQFDYRSSGKNGDTTDFKAGDQFIIEDYSEATWCDAVPHKRAQTGELIIDDQCGRISIPGNYLKLLLPQKM
eukprot:Tbor_TRINITY_DN2797_c0_g1::TRINITY_DN2797_c0_g1_i1::g.15277::m.15277